MTEAELSDEQKAANAKISSYQNLMEGHTEVVVSTKAGHNVLAG